MAIKETKETPVWEAVAELEKQHYTRDEIADILFDVRNEMQTQNVGSVSLPTSISSPYDDYFGEIGEYIIETESVDGRITSLTLETRVDEKVEAVDYTIED